MGLIMDKAKTGECYYRDEAGVLWLAESFVDEKGMVTSEDREIEEEQICRPAPCPI
jgi:hypothetical protein